MHIYTVHKSCDDTDRQRQTRRICANLQKTKKTNKGGGEQGTPFRFARGGYSLEKEPATS